ncbi:MAG: type IV toxin-antitoxin system AbiEi family antitoxin [Alphaproteobacteria bacterium]|nr:type IV toxin-antitoxin system AbiEi family antitoxin [Alphaproteobacteria bacterium]
MSTLRDYITRIRSEGYLSFTTQEAAQDLRISESTVRVKCKRLKDRGDLLSPVKGLYIILPPEHHKMGSLPADELVPIVMKYWKMDYYVCLLSAALYHGASHQKPQVFQVMINRRERGIKSGKVVIKLVYKKSLKNSPQQQFTTKSGYLNVATPELTVIDLLLYPKLCGGLNNIATILSELIEGVDSNKLLQLAEQTKQKIWIQRLGYILEQIESDDENRKNILIEKLQKFTEGKKFFYIPLAPEIQSLGFPRNKRWKIIVNTSIEADE